MKRQLEVAGRFARAFLCVVGAAAVPYCAAVALAQRPDPAPDPGGPVDDAAYVNGPQSIEEAHVPAGEPASVASAALYEIPRDDLRKLVTMKPLPFTVWQWAVDRDVRINPANNRALMAWAQVTHSLGVNDYFTGSELALFNAMVVAVNGTLTANVSPWHRTGCDRDPTKWEGTGDEMAYLQRYFKRLQGLNVGVLALDSECYYTASPLVTARLDMVYDLAKEMLPGVPIRWYRNGDWAPNLRCKNDGDRGIIWYRPGYDYQLGWYSRWQEKLTEQGLDPETFTIWAPLGPGYGPNGWTWNLGLDPIHYEHLGRKIRFLGGDLMMYPGPWRPYVTDFFPAFEAFHRGATE